MEAVNSSQATAPTADDKYYQWNKAGQTSMLRKAQWTKDVLYFKHAKISTLALVKMANHAQAGNNIEVLGMLQGKIEENTVVVMDVFALPVEGTETRVNAQAEGYEYAATYQELCNHLGQEENVVGWYHSHPGYGCWLSGIDVETQVNYQSHYDPFIAVVIDHLRSSANGKMDVGAFRTYPQNYKPLETGKHQYQSIPLEKIQDFGVHSSSYYRLEVSFFCSSISNHILEILWNQNWVNTFAASDADANQQYTTNRLNDLSAKVEDIMKMMASSEKMKARYALEDKSRVDKCKNLSKDLRCFFGETVNLILAEQTKRNVFTSLAQAKRQAFGQLDNEDTSISNGNVSPSPQIT